MKVQDLFLTLRCRAVEQLTPLLLPLQTALGDVWFCFGMDRPVRTSCRTLNLVSHGHRFRCCLQKLQPHKTSFLWGFLRASAGYAVLQGLLIPYFTVCGVLLLALLTACGPDNDFADE